MIVQNADLLKIEMPKGQKTIASVLVVRQQKMSLTLQFVVQNVILVYPDVHRIHQMIVVLLSKKMFVFHLFRVLAKFFLQTKTTVSFVVQ